MQESQTLEEALFQENFRKEKAGSAEQIAMLTSEARALTRKEATEALQKEKHQLSPATIQSLKHLVAIRLNNGQPVLPWSDIDLLYKAKAEKLNKMVGW